MSCEKRNHVHYWCAKKWDPFFSNEQNIEKRNSYLESRQDINADGDELSIFLRDSEESGPSSLVEEIDEFCNSEYVEEEEEKGSEGEQHRTAWLDDRSFGVISSEGARIYENRLTPTELYNHLNTQVWSLRSSSKEKLCLLTELKF